MKNISVISRLFLFGLFLSLAQAKAADPAPAARSWRMDELALTPILNGGRIKPLEAFAREVVLFDVGSLKFKKWMPLELILSWVAYPEAWEAERFIKIGREDARSYLQLDDKRLYFSPAELVANPVLLRYFHPTELPKGKKESPRDQELRVVVERLGLFQNIISGQGWTLMPRSGSKGWGSLIETAQIPAKTSHDEEIQHSFFQMIQAYQTADLKTFQAASALLRWSIGQAAGEASQALSESGLKAEVYYHWLKPFFWAWVAYLVAALSWSGSLLVQSRKRGWVAGATVATVLAVGIHLIGIGLRCYVAGRPPVTNMYESILWVSLGVMIFGGVIYGLSRQLAALAVATALACLGLIAGDNAPNILDPHLNPLMPVLRSNYWLTVHVLTITLAYSAFALALGFANLTLFQFYRKAALSKIQNFNQLTYRAIQFGVVFIAAGTILGGIWADYSWGRFWGWDPKEVWALITLLCYIVILHARYTQWIGPFGFAVLSALSFLSVLMAWYGVNFVLGAGLHSYGFSTGGTGWILGFVGLELAYIVWIALNRHHRLT